jgi:hypothetical protein
MPEKHVVVVFQPAMRGECLTLAGQVQQVFGPFDDGDAAERFCKTFKANHPGIAWEFLVTPLDSPLSATPTHMGN